MINNGGFGLSARCVWDRDEIRKTMNSHKSSRENWKCLKIDLFAQNTRFSRLSQVASKSPGPVTRTLKTKILKTLSKCFLRLKVLPVKESRGKPQKSLSPLATGPSTREQVTRLSWENPNFEKHSKYFSRLGHWPASESRKISVWARDWDMRLDQPVIESPKQGNTVFEIFYIFAKNKRLSKNN